MIVCLSVVGWYVFVCWWSVGLLCSVRWFVEFFVWFDWLLLLILCLVVGVGIFNNCCCCVVGLWYLCRFWVLEECLLGLGIFVDICIDCCSFFGEVVCKNVVVVMCNYCVYCWYGLVDWFWKLVCIWYLYDWLF